jgi:hypothetical protein
MSVIWWSTVTAMNVKCDRLWKHVRMLHRHERTGTGDVIYKYHGGVYHTPKTVFDRLEDEGIDVPEDDRYYPYRATYDIEVMLQTINDPRSWSGPVITYYSSSLCIPTFLPIPSPSALFPHVIPVRRWSPACSI